jgi:hypothetical protein
MQLTVLAFRAGFDSEQHASQSCPVRPPAWALPTAIPSRVISHRPRATRLHRPGFVALQEIVIRRCEADSKPHRKSSISNTQMVGGTGHYLNRLGAGRPRLLETLSDVQAEVTRLRRHRQ